MSDIALIIACLVLFVPLILDRAYWKRKATTVRRKTRPTKSNRPSRQLLKHEVRQKIEARKARKVAVDDDDLFLIYYAIQMLSE